MNPAVVLVDTSVFLNILDVPGFNQRRHDAIQVLTVMVNEPRTSLLLPIPAILETGNHIAHLSDGRQRRKYGGIFVGQVAQAFDGEAPWQPTGFPDSRVFQSWLAAFPESAMREIGLGDLWIVKEWEAACHRHPRHRVRVWSFDRHLSGLDRTP